MANDDADDDARLLTRVKNKWPGHPCRLSLYARVQC